MSNSVQILGWFSAAMARGFPLESFTEARRRNLDRHIPPETRIVGFVHFAHAALADGRDDFIRTESITWLEWHLND